MLSRRGGITAGAGSVDSRGRLARSLADWHASSDGPSPAACAAAMKPLHRPPGHASQTGCRIGSVADGQGWRAAMIMPVTATAVAEFHRRIAARRDWPERSLDQSGNAHSPWGWIARSKRQACARCRMSGNRDRSERDSGCPRKAGEAFEVVEVGSEAPTECFRPRQADQCDLRPRIAPPQAAQGRNCTEQVAQVQRAKDGDTMRHGGWGLFSGATEVGRSTRRWVPQGGLAHAFHRRPFVAGKCHFWHTTKVVEACFQAIS